MRLLNLVLRDQVVSSLCKAGLHQLASKLESCSTEQTIIRCEGCKKAQVVWNHCDNRVCPVCQPRLARQRGDELAWWVRQVGQPKHVVLTVQNVATLTADYVQAFKKRFQRLQRSRFAANWRGGMYSLEVTHGASGWHLHLHALIDAKWIDSGDLARKWAEIVGQDFAIVKVVDARNTDYLRELCKYTVKGTDLASWEPSIVAEYVKAFERVRTFGTFGSLYKRREAFALWREELLQHRRTCECGCSRYSYFSIQEWEWECAQGGTRPPPKLNVRDPFPQPFLDLGDDRPDLRAMAR